MKKSTMETYSRRMRTVLDTLADRLDSDLDLSELAGAACFSPFHFHRVFRGVVGESIGSLIRRLRLERSAWMLLEGDEPIGVIALRAGYQSAATFGRAFAAAFGESPARFRRVRRSIPMLQAPSGYHYHPVHGMQTFHPVRREGEREVEGRTVRLEPMRVLAIDHRGPYGTIGAAFERLGALTGESRIDVSGSQWLAIFLDDPETVPAEELRSRACVTVTEVQEAPAGVQGASIVEIPGGLYATSRHEGPYAGLPEAWNDLCGTWIPGNGLKPSAGVCFEIYVRSCDEAEDPDQCITDLYEPVEPVE